MDKSPMSDLSCNMVWLHVSLSMLGPGPALSSLCLTILFP